VDKSEKSELPDAPSPPRMAEVSLTLQPALTWKPLETFPEVGSLHDSASSFQDVTSFHNQDQTATHEGCNLLEETPYTDTQLQDPTDMHCQ
jgi:hypothetical protein